MKNPLGVLRAGLRGHDGDPANRVALAPRAHAKAGRGDLSRFKGPGDSEGARL